MEFSLGVDDILKKLSDAEVHGNSIIQDINGIASLKNAQEGDLSFLSNPKYKSEVKSSLATFILLPLDFHEEPKEGQVFIKTKNPSQALANVCRLIQSILFEGIPVGVHDTAFVHESAVLESGVCIGPFSYIGSNVKIGKNTIVESHCYVGEKVIVGENTHFHPGCKILSLSEVGNGVVLNSGVVVGSEGYGFEQVGSFHEKIPHLGKVVIEDDVEIGANTCIDRARLEATIIGAGSKIDNLVQIGHNVRIGKGCLIVAQVGIAGSVEFEDGVIVGGQAGFAGHLKVGKGAKIAGQAGITKDVPPDAYLKGNPAIPIQLAHKIAVLQRKLPDLFKRIAQEPDKK
ncbi:MAG: UDP-3-O-(3-hydroxymyristoyl)glucosamine N-acyltransferase [Verrucomicrobia bacterium TMED56]|jgi:UDP-3-O-[3-hydroxymyristoyl] glucosamine N-acyltransferase|nr:MAG: UDP-3-O-(3-hydroxymyristoyl)glucosamine N-acyltransferase [Verrucomicrobia bacterium TMED56]